MNEIKVLLIEDNPVEARMMKAVLAKAGAVQPLAVRYDLQCAATLAAGLEALGREEIDVVLLDLSLPDADGLETLTRVLEQQQDTPIVVLTGRDDENLAVKAMQAGAQDYIVKGQSDGQLISRAVRYAIERHRMLRSLSLIDDLTGLYNRRGFTTLAEQHFKMRNRAQKESLLIYADMDGLKKINDTYGHHAGSKALVKIADVLRETFRSTDIIARIGGDEFTVLAPDSAPDCIETITSRLEENLITFNRRREVPYELSLSVGVARIEVSSEKTFDEVMSEADEAMYVQKRQKRCVAP